MFYKWPVCKPKLSLFCIESVSVLIMLRTRRFGILYIKRFLWDYITLNMKLHLYLKKNDLWCFIILSHWVYGTVKTSIWKLNHTALEYEKSILISHLQHLTLMKEKHSSLICRGLDNSTDWNTSEIAFVSMNSEKYWSLKTEGHCMNWWQVAELSWAVNKRMENKSEIWQITYNNKLFDL